MNSEAPQCALCALRLDCPLTGLDPACAERGTEVRGRSWRRGALLLRQGQRPASFLFVKCGLLLLRQLGPDGVERSLGVVGRGHLLGLQGFYGLPAGVSLRAVGPVAVCDIPFARLHAAPAPARLMRYNHRALGALARWGLIMRMPKLGQRMAAALLLLAEAQAPGLVELPNQSQMAELLGVTRESVNRAYRVFEALGALQRPSRTVAALDQGLLRRLLKRPPQELA